MPPGWQAAVVSALGAGAPRWSRIGGNAAIEHWSLALGRSRYFVKAMAIDAAQTLAAEGEALLAIAATGTVRVPEVCACGTAGDATYLALEWLDLANRDGGAALGDALGRMHATSAPRFGWHRDNTIGATPQANDWAPDWPAFYRDRRLAPQLALAARNGYDTLRSAGEKLIDAVPRLLTGHRPVASLLHGDLWSGNAAALRDGTPVIYDPSTYYGDRETDLAMTELFGGFGADFYSAYAATAPLAAGYARRRTLYNLYHVLNHLNLFGASYLARAQSMIAELIALR